ncbi:MAG: DUF4126 domain-containing protein [Myxococcota bacterium]
MALGLTALLLAALSGIRTWFPLWLVAFAAWVGLSASSYAGGSLGQVGIVGALTVLWAAEIGADKVIGLDHRLQSVGILLKPIVATFVAVVAWPEVSPLLAGMVGAVVGGVSAAGLAVAKGRLRRFATAHLPGWGNVLVSAGEDVFVVVMGILALVAPVAALVWGAVSVVSVGTLVRLAGSAVSVEELEREVPDLGVLMAAQPPQARGEVGIWSARHHL